jgi:hypothetical protein
LVISYNEFRKEDNNMGMFKKEVESNLELSAIVTRADGTTENLGVIAVTKKNGLFKRLLNLMKKK